MNLKEKVMRIMMTGSLNELEDKILGCIMGGAIGDALGFPVEFYNYDEIRKYFDSKGIRNYPMNKGEISDDTQMTLFTIDGLVSNKEYDVKNIYKSYLDWYATQNYPYSARYNYPGYNKDSKLLNIEGLYNLMAPGGTCLSALGSKKMGTIENPLNNSKGCGGIMRVAPVGIFFTDSRDVAQNAAEIAAITHGHPLGYIPAAILACMINLIIYKNDTIKEALKESMKIVEKLYPETNDVKQLINKTIELSGNSLSDIENINELGGGWVAEETLAIALYCCLRYPDNFEKAIIASVNHSGDSDSTGAVTGNIMGAILGYKKIPRRYIENLDMSELIHEMAIKIYKK